MECKCGNPSMGYIMTTNDSETSYQTMYRCRYCGRTGYKTQHKNVNWRGEVESSYYSYKHSEPNPDKVSEYTKKYMKENPGCFSLGREG